jgi:hypothetical protein
MAGKDNPKSLSQPQQHANRLLLLDVILSAVRCQLGLTRGARRAAALDNTLADHHLSRSILLIFCKFEVCSC